MTCLETKVLMVKYPSSKAFEPTCAGHSHVDKFKFSGGKWSLSGGANQLESKSLKWVDLKRCRSPNQKDQERQESLKSRGHWIATAQAVVVFKCRWRETRSRSSNRANTAKVDKR